MESYRLFEVNEYIRRVMALNFEEAVWIECEINQIGQKRGHHYLELVEKSEETDEIIAKARASMWYKDSVFIKKKLGKLFQSILQAGTQVKLKCEVDFHEVYGLNYTIKDIDVNFTVGQMELQRQKIIERLKSEDLLYKNQLKELAGVIQNIAVVSSETAAGFADFFQELKTNAYGYAFQVALFDSSVQGSRMEAEIVQSFKEINAEWRNYQAVIVIRGGGSKLDLSGFDNYHIAAQIAKCKLPVITGIGHEIDQTVSDLTAHTSLKTPTAVASYLIDHNMHFEGTCIDIHQRINELIFEELSYHQAELNMYMEKLKGTINQRFIYESTFLENIGTQISSETYQIIRRQKELLNKNNELVKAYSIDTILKRGFNYSFDEEGKIIKSKSEASKKKTFTLQYHDGKLNVTNNG